MLHDPFARDFQLIEVLHFLWLFINYAYLKKGIRNDALKFKYLKTFGL